MNVDIYTLAQYRSIQIWRNNVYVELIERPRDFVSALIYTFENILLIISWHKITIELIHSLNINIHVAQFARYYTSIMSLTPFISPDDNNTVSGM